MKKFVIILVTLLLVGCTNTVNDSKQQEEAYMYNRITAQEAKEMLDRDKDIILLDVRTLEEYKEQHIENSILLPFDEIQYDADDVLPEKEATILIYCRSGRRSAIAALELIDMGYQNVYDFGGILDWPYETALDSALGTGFFNGYIE